MLLSGTTVSLADAATSIMSVATSVISTVTGNATLMAFFCVGFVGSVIAIVKQLRG